MSIAIWAYATWVLLTWTLTAEQLLFGAVGAAAIATALWPLGEVLSPWRLLSIGRLWRVARIALYVMVSMIRANLSLSRRIWSPSRPIRPGMLVVPTAMSSDGQLAAIGILTSLIVDNQIVDLDPARSLLQYHAVSVESDDPTGNRGRINGRLEALVAPLGTGTG